MRGFIKLSDLKLNASGTDIELGATDLVIGQTEGEAVRNALLLELRLIKGTWFLNINSGIPYYDQIYNQAQSKTIADILIKQVINKQALISYIKNYNSTYDPNTQRLDISFEAVLSSNEEVVSIDMEIV